MTDTIEIQNIIRSYFENLYSNKIETTEDIDKFLDICSSQTEPGGHTQLKQINFKQ